MNIPGMADDAETVEQPQDDRDHDDEIENGFDRALHWDVGVDQPEDNTDNDQGEDYGYERHGPRIAGSPAGKYGVKPDSRHSTWILLLVAKPGDHCNRSNR